MTLLIAPWYPRFRISVVLFQYHKQHQYFIHGHILKPISLPVSDLLQKCDAEDKFSIKEFWHQLNIEITIVIQLPFCALYIVLGGDNESQL
jgi:hypothetical protein